MKTSKGKMHNSRLKMKKDSVNTVNRYLRTFDKGEKVYIDIDSSSKFPHPKFHKKTGEVVKKQGESYMVKVKDKNATKHIVLRPEHLKVIKNGNN